MLEIIRTSKSTFRHSLPTVRNSLAHSAVASGASAIYGGRNFEDTREKNKIQFARCFSSIYRFFYHFDVAGGLLAVSFFKKVEFEKIQSYPKIILPLFFQAPAGRQVGRGGRANPIKVYCNWVRCGSTPNTMKIYGTKYHTIPVVQ